MSRSEWLKDTVFLELMMFSWLSLILALPLETMLELLVLPEMRQEPFLETRTPSINSKAYPLLNKALTQV